MAQNEAQARHEAHAQNTYRDFLLLAASELGVEREPTERAILAVVRALEALLPFDDMSNLASQLPMLLRESLARCDRPEPERPHGRTREEFVRVVADELGLDPERAEQQVRAVFRVLAQTVSQGEVRKVVHVLPTQLRPMWPSLD
jgi:uncharacterized protein (DUF2267 family)